MRSTERAGGRESPCPRGSRSTAGCARRAGTTYCPRRPMRNSPDHGRMGALQDLDDLAIGAAAGFDARDAHDHAVAVHGLLGGIGRDEDVARQCPSIGPLGDQEAVAIAVHVEAAHGEFAAAGGDGRIARTAARSGRRAPPGAPAPLPAPRARSPLAPSSRTSCLKLARACGRREIWASRAASVIS